MIGKTEGEIEMKVKKKKERGGEKQRIQEGGEGRTKRGMEKGREQDKGREKGGGRLHKGAPNNIIAQRIPALLPS